jgi:hypothetical protein
MWPLVAMILGVLAAAFGLVLLVGYQIRKENKKEGEAQKPQIRLKEGRGVPRRICDSCGEEKDVAGGKTCENGHFICKSCVWSAPALLGPGERKQCPLCDKPLR